MRYYRGQLIGFLFPVVGAYGTEEGPSGNSYKASVVSSICR
jgi:hypothetical protein